LRPLVLYFINKLWRTRPTPRALACRVETLLDARLVRTRPLGISLFPQPLLQILVVFFLERRIAGTRIDLGRLVLAGHDLLFGPLIVDVSDVGPVDHLLSQVRRDEVNAFAVAEYDVARQDRGVADAHRNVIAGNHDVAYRCRMHAADIDGHVDGIDTFQIADGAVHHHAGPGSCVNKGGQVVAHDGTLLDLAEQIDHKDVALL